MMQPETPLEIWLARDGWNEIDPGLRRQRAKGRVWLILAALLACVILIITQGGRIAWMEIVIGLICLVLFASHMNQLYGSGTDLKPHVATLSFENLLTGEGRVLLQSTLLKIVGPNNTRDRRPGEYPLVSELQIQLPARQVLNKNELELLEPLAHTVVKKLDSMDRGEREPFLFIVNFSESMRIAFSLLAKLQSDETQLNVIETEFRRMIDIIESFPAVLVQNEPEADKSNYNAYQAWRAFTRQHKVD